eukprot:6825799-Alexandrium_andersonii.AAC.1
MGLFPARGTHSEIGRTSQTPRDSTNRISSEGAAVAMSEGKTALVMSPRKCCAPFLAQRLSEPSDHAGPLGSSSGGTPKSATSTMSTSSISTPAA